MDIDYYRNFIAIVDAGSILYNKARYICSTESAAMKEITDCSASFHGTLRISLSPSMSIGFIKSSLSGRTEIGIVNAPLKQLFCFPAWKTVCF